MVFNDVGFIKKKQYLSAFDIKKECLPIGNIMIIKTSNKKCKTFSK